MSLGATPQSGCRGVVLLRGEYGGRGGSGGRREREKVGERLYWREVATLLCVGSQ